MRHAYKIATFMHCISPLESKPLMQQLSAKSHGQILGLKTCARIHLFEISRALLINKRRNINSLVIITRSVFAMQSE